MPAAQVAGGNPQCPAARASTGAQIVDEMAAIHQCSFWATLS
jgi:hypothetical protein